MVQTLPVFVRLVGTEFPCFRVDSMAGIAADLGPFDGRFRGGTPPASKQAS